MDLELAGQTVIVTGGASNIGRAIVLEFAREGSHVLLADIDAPQAEKVAQEAKSLPGDATVIATDVTKLEQVEQMVTEAIARFGAIDVLVNNIGWDEPLSFLETTPDLWERIIAINYRSVLNTAKTVLPRMIERRKGAIVSIASDAGRIGEYKEAVYSGCKAGVIAFSKTLAREVGRYAIRSNVVCPGITLPESPEEVGEMSMHARTVLSDEQRERAVAWYPLRKLGRPLDIAMAVAFLASDRVSGHITGQTLSVSGGYTMM